MSDKPKKKIVWQQYIATAFFVLIGAACGFLMIAYIDAPSAQDRSLWEEMLTLFGLFLAMYVAFFVQMIIHEAGHFIFGMLSGYTFSSFRIMSFMWLKENGRIRFKRLTLAGTGGQCLMVPPEMTDGKIPVILYNLGGSLMNIIAGLVFLGLYALTADVPFLPAFLLMLTVIGFVLAVMNGIPMRTGTVDNDGHNAFSLRKNHNALRSFWVQLKTNEQISKGIRLKDMPEDWFSVPADQEMKNSMVAVMGVFACNRLMDQQCFEDADTLMEHLLEIDSGIVGLHRNLIVCDRIYCELIGENRQDAVDNMLTKEQKKFMKSMKKFPSVLRTEYAYALLAEKDTVKAETLKTQFEKCAKTYPYPGEIQGERELVEIAAAKVL